MAWTALALAFEVRLIAGSWPGLGLALTALTVVCTLLSAYSRWAVTPLLTLAYLVPAIGRLAHGGAPYTPNEIIWLAPLFGVMAPDLVRTPWRLPPSWRVPLVAASFAVAVSAPIAILREVDFIPGLLFEREAWHWVGTTWPSLMAAWVAYAAIGWTLGLLWFDWLFGRPADSLVPSVILPLLASAALLVAVALYQFFVDVSFMNQSVYAHLGRATGTYFDANLAGMIVAMWMGGAFVLADRLGRWHGLASAGIALAGWTAVWATGSRTSFGTALIITVMALVVRSRNIRLRPVHVFIGTAVLALFAGIITSGGGQTIGPVARLVRLAPSRLHGMEAAEAVGRELWNRNNYGAAAVAAIEQYPWFGLGAGTFNMMASRLMGGISLAPDNAQNWLRHQLAEFGIIGAAGFVAWFVLFATFVLRRRRGLGPGAGTLRGVLVAFGVISMLGMPGQDAIVALTFWTFAFWFAREVGQAPAPDARIHPAWSVALALVTAAVGAGLVVTTEDLRPAARARSADWAYSFGLRPPEQDGPLVGYRVGSERAATVLDRLGPWLSVTVRLRDIPPSPIAVRVRVDGASVLKGQLSTTEPLTGAVPVAGAARALLEVDARPADESLHIAFGAPRELYLITWEFHPQRP